MINNYQLTINHSENLRILCDVPSVLLTKETTWMTVKPTKTKLDIIWRQCVFK